MVAAMPRSEAENCIVALLSSSAPIGNVIFVDCLRGLAKPWSPDVARQCLARLRQEAPDPPVAPRQAAAAIMPIAARAIPRECFAEALAPWPQISGEHYIDKVWIREVADFIETVQLRKTLMEETRS